MEKRLIAVTTSAFILLGAAVTASAQSTATQPSAQTQSSATQGGPGMMGPRMMQEGGMMSGGMMGGGMMGQRPIPGTVMRIIFALMDSDGNGTVSLQEFQAAHERMFKAMDANKDGVLTLQEIQVFMGEQTSGQASGQTRSGPQQ
jgi:EF hand domain-containing protein